MLVSAGGKSLERCGEEGEEDEEHGLHDHLEGGTHKERGCVVSI